MGLNKLSVNSKHRARAGVCLLPVLICALTAQCLGQQSNSAHYEYDRLNRVTKVTYDGSGASIVYTYDAAGNRTATTVVGGNPAPVLTSLNPSSVPAGTRGFTLGVNGSNLVNGATVRWNGSTRSATYFGSYVTTALTDADLASPGTFTVVVTNPAPGGAQSNSLTFTVGQSASALRIDGVSPRAGRAAGGQQVTLTGSFANLSSVRLGGTEAAIVSKSDTQVTVATPQHTAGAVAIELLPASGTTYTKANAFAYLPTVFTDDTIVARVTTAKSLHVTELREAVDSLRAVAGLPAAPWTDAALTPTGTIIRAIHVRELRTYLDDALSNLGYATTSYTDPALPDGFVIRSVYIEELRQRIRAAAG